MGRASVIKSVGHSKSPGTRTMRQGGAVPL